MTTHPADPTASHLVQPVHPADPICSPPPVHPLYDQATHELVAQVRLYADRGWHVFPLLPGSKKPATPTHRAAHCYRTDPWCRNGHTGWQDRATTNPDRITRAWTTPTTRTTDGASDRVARPDSARNDMRRSYGVGIATGPSRLLVIDTDVHKPGDPVPPVWAGHSVQHGDDVLAALTDEHHGHLPPTYTVATPSGGRHRYYQAPALPGGAQLGNSAGLLGWLIDTRGWGGYVAAPPTALDTGAYRLLDDRPPALLPDWIVRLLTRQPRPRPEAVHGPHSTHNGLRDAARVAAVHAADRREAYIAAAIDGEMTRVRTAAAGKRNHTLFVAAVALGQLVAGHALDEYAARTALTIACEVHIAMGAFTAADADATITSGLTRGALKPRTHTWRTGRTA